MECETCGTMLNWDEVRGLWVCPDCLATYTDAEVGTTEIDEWEFPPVQDARWLNDEEYAAAASIRRSERRR